MSKNKTVFFCKECGYESVKWLGRCPSCQTWNSFVEEVIQKDKQEISKIPDAKNKEKFAHAVILNEVNESNEPRIVLASKELNRVLGGGLVKGSVVLVAGEPGIGKSTLFLQIALRQKNSKVLYVSGEESLQQIKMRSKRLTKSNEEVYLFNDVDTQKIIKESISLEPDIIIIDSIQTIQSPYLDSAAGTVSQIRESTAELIQLAKKTHTPIFLIGHINKDGNIAGPKLLEHMVDVVLQFEGDRHYAYRMIRTLKNRYGSTSELGIYEMLENGLREVNNPSELLLGGNNNLSGTAVASTLEGLRPLMIDAQALVAMSMYGTPQRTTNGFDLRRLQLILAVLEKRAGFNFGQKDVFLNMAGNIKVEDPAIDLAVAAAILSSLLDTPIPHTTCFAGELSLSGEIRPVSKIEQRLQEAEKLGFEKMIISSNTKLSKAKTGLTLVKIEDIAELQKVL